MTALLYRTRDGWRLMLTPSDVRGPFRKRFNARQFASIQGWKVRRSLELDTP